MSENSRDEAQHRPGALLIGQRAQRHHRSCAPPQYWGATPTTWAERMGWVVGLHWTETAVRLLVAFGLTFALGFERLLRGSPAGDRTFSLIGVGAAVIGVLSQKAAPNALAGAVTGIGFIGWGLVFRQSIGDSQVVKGVTTAAAIFASAALGAAAGEGQLALAAMATALGIFCLELQHVPALQVLDARHWQHRFADDKAPEPNRPSTNSET